MSFQKLVEQKCVASVCLTYHWCTAQVWLKRTTKCTLILYHCCTDTSESRSSPAHKEFGTTQIFSSNQQWDILSSISQSVDRVIRCLYWPAGVWSESTAGQQRGTEKQTSHTSRQNWTWHRQSAGVWDSMWPSKMDVYWEFAESPAELLTHQCVSACVFTLSNVHSARESTLEKMVSKREKKKNQHSCDWNQK